MFWSAKRSRLCAAEVQAEGLQAAADAACRGMFDGHPVRFGRRLQAPSAATVVVSGKPATSPASVVPDERRRTRSAAGAVRIPGHEAWGIQFGVARTASCRARLYKGSSLQGHGKAVRHRLPVCERAPGGSASRQVHSKERHVKTQPEGRAELVGREGPSGWRLLEGQRLQLGLRQWLKRRGPVGAALCLVACCAEDEGPQRPDSPRRSLGVQAWVGDAGRDLRQKGDARGGVPEVRREPRIEVHVLPCNATPLPHQLLQS